MLDVSQDIRFLVEFATNTEEFLALLREKTLDSLRALHEGLAVKTAGRTTSAEASLAALRMPKRGK